MFSHISECFIILEYIGIDDYFDVSFFQFFLEKKDTFKFSCFMFIEDDY